jgi:hypothetical protein
VDIEDPGDRQMYLDMVIGMADHVRDIGVAADDHIVLLSTCSPTETNGRDILVGRITDEVYADPFAERVGTGSSGAGAEAVAGRLRVAIIPATIAAAALAIALYRKKRIGRA